MLILAKINLVLCWVSLIFVLTSKPLPAYEFSGMTLYDKGAHFILFAILAYLIILVGLEAKKISFKIIALISLVISFLYAIFSEYWQVFVPGRDLNEVDLLAGGLGIVSAILFSHIVYNKTKPKLLLHICCASCGVYVSQVLKKEYGMTLYFYNPNIYPESEYDKRLEETKKMAKKFGLNLVAKEYNHAAWLNKIKGHEQDPERGERCLICYKDRMEDTVKVAKEKHFNYFSTTLSVSPYKDAQAISQIGNDLSDKHGVKFLDKDFKKKDGYKKSVELSKELGLYRQDYCGCEFSYNAKQVTRKGDKF